MCVCVCVCVQFGKTPLMHAIKQKKGFDIVKLLVKSKANMDAKDNVSGVAVRLRVRVTVRV